MQYKLFGFQKAEFVSKDSGEKITGMNLYLAQPINKDGQGYYIFRQFVIDSKLPVLELNKDYDVSYRRGSGKLDKINKIN